MQTPDAEPLSFLRLPEALAPAHPALLSWSWRGESWLSRPRGPRWVGVGFCSDPLMVPMGPASGLSLGWVSIRVRASVAMGGGQARPHPVLTFSPCPNPMAGLGSQRAASPESRFWVWLRADGIAAVPKATGSHRWPPGRGQGHSSGPFSLQKILRDFLERAIRESHRPRRSRRLRGRPSLLPPHQELRVPESQGCRWQAHPNSGCRPGDRRLFALQLARALRGGTRGSLGAQTVNPW